MWTSKPHGILILPNSYTDHTVSQSLLYIVKYNGQLHTSVVIQCSYWLAASISFSYLCSADQLSSSLNNHAVTLRRTHGSKVVRSSPRSGYWYRSRRLAADWAQYREKMPFVFEGVDRRWPWGRMLLGDVVSCVASLPAACHCQRHPWWTEEKCYIEHIEPFHLKYKVRTSCILACKVLVSNNSHLSAVSWISFHPTLSLVYIRCDHIKAVPAVVSSSTDISFRWVRSQERCP